MAGGVVTGWQASFTIKDLSGTIIMRGTKSLAPGGTGTGSCTDVGTHFTAAASSTSLTYTTTYPFTETGPSQATLSYDVTFPSGVGSFSEHFGPAVQPGCDTQGDSNGNDDCQQ